MRGIGPLLFLSGVCLMDVDVAGAFVARVSQYLADRHETFSTEVLPEPAWTDGPQILLSTVPAGHSLLQLHVPSLEKQSCRVALEFLKHRSYHDSLLLRLVFLWWKL